MNQCADCQKQTVTIGGLCWRCHLAATERGHRFSRSCLARGRAQCKGMVRWAKKET